MGYFDILRHFYQFIKEVILGKATLAQAYQYDRRRVWVLVIIMVSLVLNVIAIPALYRSVDRLIDVREALEAQQCSAQEIHAMG